MQGLGLLGFQQVRGLAIIRLVGVVLASTPSNIWDCWGCVMASGIPGCGGVGVSQVDSLPISRGDAAPTGGFCASHCYLKSPTNPLRKGCKDLTHFLLQDLPYQKRPLAFKTDRYSGRTSGLTLSMGRKI